MKYRIANAVVVKFTHASNKELINMTLLAQERGTWVRRPKKEEVGHDRNAKEGRVVR